VTEPVFAKAMADKTAKISGIKKKRRKRLNESHSRRFLAV
jgi:hypothetical protein